MKRKQKPVYKEHETITRKIRSKEANIQQLPKSEGRIKRKKKPVIYIDLPPKKKGVQVMIRKDGKPNCFVCYQKLDLLRKLMKMKEENQDFTDSYNTLRLRVNNTIVRIPSNRNHPMYRHVKCEAGSHHYNKNKLLKKHLKKTLEE